MVEEKSRQEIDNERSTRRGSGNMLAAARKQQNKTVEEIAEELNLSVTQIKTIELDQTDGLPEPTYVRGYIRSYAKLLGLNSEDVLKNYLNPNWQQSTNLDDMPRGIGSADEPSSRRLFTPAKMIALLAIVGSLGFLWYSGMLANMFGTSNDQPTTVVGTTQPVASDSNSAQTVSGDSNVDSNGADSNADAASAASVSNIMNLAFTQTSWVDIRDADDNRLAYKSYATGEELSVASEGAMSVFIGNAEGVSVELNGESFDISPYREGVYAKFTVGDE